MADIVFEDRIATYPNRYKVIPTNGDPSYQVVLERADAPTVVGTPMNAETFNTLVDKIEYESEQVDAKDSKTLYNLGVYDTYQDNGDGTATITRRTGYLCVDGVNVKVDSKTSVTGKNVYYVTNYKPYIACPASSTEQAEIVSNLLPTRSNFDLIETGLLGISVYHDNAKHPNLCGSIAIGLDTNDATDVATANTYFSQNPLHIRYKRKQSYTELVSAYRPLGTLDQQGEQWVRSEWEKGLNVCNVEDITVVATGTSSTVSKRVTLTLPHAGTYTLSAHMTNTGSFYSGGGYVVMFRDSAATNKLCEGVVGDGYTFTSDVTTLYVYFYASLGSAISNTQTYSNIMVNEGDRAYPYQPYRGERARTTGTYPDMTVGKLVNNMVSVNATSTTLPGAGVYLVFINTGGTQPTCSVLYYDGSHASSGTISGSTRNYTYRCVCTTVGVLSAESEHLTSSSSSQCNILGYMKIV